MVDHAPGIYVGKGLEPQSVALLLHPDPGRKCLIYDKTARASEAHGQRFYLVREGHAHRVVDGHPEARTDLFEARRRQTYLRAGGDLPLRAVLGEDELLGLLL